MTAPQTVTRPVTANGKTVFRILFMVQSGITSTFTGPRRKSLFSKAARPAAPCATYCYPDGFSALVTLAEAVVSKIGPSGQASNLNVMFAVPAIAPFGA